MHTYTYGGRAGPSVAVVQMSTMCTMHCMPKSSSPHSGTRYAP